MSWVSPVSVCVEYSGVGMGMLMGRGRSYFRGR